MICPNCRKTETSTTWSRPIKNGLAIERKRHCKNCGPFKTQENHQGSKKKRKIENRTLWLNWRFNFYIVARLTDVLMPLSKMNEKFSFDNIHLYKKNGKLKANLYEIKNNKMVLIKTLSVPPRKVTIKRIVTSDTGYWEKRNELVKDSPVEDRKYPAQVDLEVNAFYRSVIKHIKDEQYNREYVANCYRHFPRIHKRMLESDGVWETWKKIR